MNHLLIFLLSCSALAQLTGRDIAERAYDIEDGKSMKANVTITITDKNQQQKTRELTMFRKDLLQRDGILFKVNSPATLRGTSFLTWNKKNGEAMQWIYLPALKRIRRIATGDKDKSFIGSDFSYQDLSKIELHKNEFKLLKEENVAENSCYLIEAIPKDKNERIQKRLAWIRKDNFLIIKAQLFDQKGELIKELSTSPARQIDSVWTIENSWMKDYQNQSTSQLSLSKIKYNLNLADMLFDKQGMK